MNGEKEEIIRPRVREKEGSEVKLELYEMASSQRNLFGKEIILEVALGIDRHGQKHALDFEQGTSESAQTVVNLFARLHKRGLKEPAGRRSL